MQKKIYQDYSKDLYKMVKRSLKTVSEAIDNYTGYLRALVDLNLIDKEEKSKELEKFVEKLFWI
jgi:hypothetical protein